MSKAAVMQITKAMALEWGRFEINVNAICPGAAGVLGGVIGSMIDGDR